MQVSSTGSATNTPSTPSSNPSTSSNAAVAQASTVNYNSFLQLLVQELKNQDPTAPSDPTAFMSQLASFSGVEQQVQTNSKLDSMLTTNALTQAESLIGKAVSNSTASGTVSSVAIGSDGTATATLTDGSTMTLGNGITIGKAAS